VALTKWVERYNTNQNDKEELKTNQNEIGSMETGSLDLSGDVETTQRRSLPVNRIITAELTSSLLKYLIKLSTGSNFKGHSQAASHAQSRYRDLLHSVVTSSRYYTFENIQENEDLLKACVEIYNFEDVGMAERMLMNS